MKFMYFLKMLRFCRNSFVFTKFNVEADFGVEGNIMIVLVCFLVLHCQA